MSMSEWFLVCAFIILIFTVLFYYVQNKKVQTVLSELKNQDSQQLLQWLSEMRASMDRNADMMTRHLSNSSDAVNQRLDSTAQLLRLLNKDLGHVHEIGQQMRDFEHFFRSPKIRGKLGERIMEELLMQVLPRSVISLQHRFQSGSIVDALINLDSGAIPVDAKFPLENFQKAQHATKEDVAFYHRREFKRDVKKHINAISRKYILPGEGTLDFAVMYVPSDTLYYEMISDDLLVKEAENNNVLLVAPNSFYYFLKLILVGLYSSKIEKTAAKFMQHISAFQQNLTETENEINTLLTHLNNSQNAALRVSNKIQNMQSKLETLTNIESDS